MEISKVSKSSCFVCFSEPEFVGLEDMKKLETEYPETNLSKLEDGRKIFVQHCSACHYLPLPYHHERSHWPKILEFMGKKAKLTDNEREMVLNYLVSANYIHSLEHQVLKE